MQLFFLPASPYTRKVCVVAIEVGLGDSIERIITNVREPAPELTSKNPLGRIPVLIADDGQETFDSPVICEYLDSLHDGPKLFPETSPQRWIALRQQAVGDGILDAAVARRFEGRRPEGERSASWMERKKAESIRALDWLEKKPAHW